MDPRYRKLAQLLVNYSTDLQKNENILIEVTDTPDQMAQALIEAAAQAGGKPYLTIKHRFLDRALFLAASEEQMKFIGEYENMRMKHMDAYVHIRGYQNAVELADVPQERMELYQKHWWNVVHSNTRVNSTKWCVLRWPLPSMAQAAKMSTEAFENFYFNVCTLDYEKMAKAMEPLKELMEKTSNVRITGPDTELSFSIKGIGAVICAGKRNIPDGECYSAPVRDSINGVISYNTPSSYMGTAFDKIRFEIKDGKIINATSSDTKRINEILDTDDGARYFGEFAIGLNPYVVNPMMDILFDEKICGSFHFTPGNAYDSTDNGNRSAVHWDLVQIQTPEYGGGEIYFDDVLIRKDGKFTLDSLKQLNPENLI